MATIIIMIVTIIIIIAIIVIVTIAIAIIIIVFIITSRSSDPLEGLGGTSLPRRATARNQSPVVRY